MIFLAKASIQSPGRFVSVADEIMSVGIVLFNAWCVTCGGQKLPAGSLGENWNTAVSVTESESRRKARNWERMVDDTRKKLKEVHRNGKVRSRNWNWSLARNEYRLIEQFNVGILVD